ncbi:proline dehydrogenase family protein [bacterium]|nr:proline dehydrogenase family protein [bacterium]MBU1881767.1 proline dehydrogenase family protein [bacterium]
MKLVNQMIATTLPLIPKSVVGYFSQRYIAGETLADAIKVSRQIQRDGACVTLDVLGEHITRNDEATAYANQYLELLDAIQSEKLDANVSLKPTQMGLKLDRSFCRDTIAKIAEKTKQNDNFVRIDMEDISCTDDTLWLYEDLKKEYPVGTVIQACLRRTDADVDQLINLNANLRLCKGIYVEPYAAAYKDREIIRQNYLHILERLLTAGCYTGIATHDEMLVWGALRIIKKLNLKPDRYEFQMLLGVQEELRKVILKAGHKLRVYIPFGAHWYAYSVRRLKENPQIAGYVMENILRRMAGKK